MPSLLDAIETKYGNPDDESLESSGEVKLVIFVPKSDHRKRLQRVLVLDKCEIDCAGDEETLGEVLSDLQELDLGHNQLANWTDVWRILKCAPCLKFLNLSFNDLTSEPISQFPNSLTSLSTLILIGTNISWKSVHSFLSAATNLKDLHLSKNSFDRVELSPNSNEETMNYSSVVKLMFDDNHIACGDELKKLGTLFPNLEHLGLSDCPISSIPENMCASFEKLQSISVSNTPLENLTDIAHFALFPSLTELRILGTSILTNLTTHERRQLFVALLPNITKLNGGAEISRDERETSERAFIRYFLEKEEPRPKRYAELVSIHGELEPLVSLDLKPQTHVKIKFIMDELIEEKDIKVYQTVKELKVFLEPLFGIIPTRMRLFYVDVGLNGEEEMKFPDKQLFSYNLHDGDEIHVYPKETPARNLSGCDRKVRTLSG
jgi:hypothetical protein